ncbi:hypothetical protein sscle_10g079870 [Sclerotinia sclerotiorum 1980 UF-70]|uniref:Uncharacterized protein n=1 Tax=Sclerotinia sclerotiorum (strain ATCC 18683 / 1980 / Ss-1) TaxID=665079 RepID=A0A1D9QE58_SCLS1|nr:hypothetical protein sscle_10g079870 [Sclerotinia sclerotiorum 1980 UF-70]
MALALSAVRRNPLSVQYPQLNESALTCKVVKLNLLIENMEIELNIAALLKPKTKELSLERSRYPISSGEVKADILMLVRKFLHGIMGMLVEPKCYAEGSFLV